jgi:hypothetical protein
VVVDAAGDVAALSVYHLPEDDAARWDGDRVTLAVLDAGLKRVAVTVPGSGISSCSAGSGALAASATPVATPGGGGGGGTGCAYPVVAVTHPGSLLVNGKPAVAAAAGGGGSPHLSVKAFDR